MARARRVSTPCWRAMRTIIALVSLRLGTERRARMARLCAAASATARGYLTPLNVSGTELVELDLALPGTRSTWPGKITARLEILLARAMAATEVRCRSAIEPRVSPARTL